MVAYVAASAASAPPPRGLPLAHPAARGSAGPAGAPGGALDRLAAGPGEGGGVGEDEAVVAFLPGPPPADDGPPLEDLEAQMGGEVASRDAATPPSTSRPARRAAGRPADEADEDLPAAAKNTPLPELDELVARLPAELRETMEDLLRVRFVAVKRVPGRDLSGPPVRDV